MNAGPAQHKLILFMSMSLDGFAARRDGVIGRSGPRLMTSVRRAIAWIESGWRKAAGNGRFVQAAAAAQT